MDSLAGALVTSKVKGLTKDLGDAVGLNEDDDHSEASVAYMEAEAKARREKDVARRKKERDELHQEREKERDKIREKYSLPPRGQATRSQQQPKKKPASSEEESKCIIS